MAGGDSLAGFLATLPQEAFAFALILTRVSAAVMLMPGFGMSEIPAMVRAGVALLVTLVLPPLLAPHMPPAPQDGAATLRLVAAELSAGLWLGLFIQTLALALPVAGEVISLMTGLSSVIVPDQDFNGSGPGLSRAFSLLIPIFIFATDLHALLLSALVSSYDLIPAGQGLPAADGAASFVAIVGESFRLALRLAAPFLFAGLLWQAGLALAGRVIRQIPFYFIAMPAQIMGGLVLLAFLLRFLLAAYAAAMHQDLLAWPAMR
jgi:flagellar biosynthetic protein FliR